MENDPVDRDAAAAQLAVLRADRAALADRVLQPWWHDAAAGLLLFGLFTAQLVEPSWLASVLVLVLAAGFGVLAWSYRSRTGVWVHPDSTVWLTWAPLVLVVAVPAFVLSDRGQVWALPVAGAVLGLALAVLSRRWTHRWIAELRGAA
jgi:cobalamin synthase